MVRGSCALALAFGTFALDGAMAVLDVGVSHVCTSVGSTPKCWGSNQKGELGRGDTNDTGDDPNEMGDELLPVEVGTGETVSDMSLGEEFTCTLLASGDVKCFGENNAGQLGLEDSMPRGELSSQMGDALPAVDFGTGLTAVSVATGCEHTCALLSDGSVKCFGYNNYGQLGQGTTQNIGDDVGEMGQNLTAVSLGDATVTAIAAGCDFTCAIVDDGAVMCWGRNTWGQLGAGDKEDRLDQTGEDLVEVDLNGSAATAITAGDGHVCVLTDDASVKCWGRNNLGQLGLGAGDNDNRGDTAASLGGNLLAVQLGNEDVPSAIDCGSFFTCVLLKDGSIKCFGDNGYGQLGIGSTEDIGVDVTDMGANLTAVDLGDTATDMAAGGSTTCAVLSDDSVKCWGRGNLGQLGQGDDESVGNTPGVLVNLDSVDAGSDTFASSPAPTPSSTVSMSPLPTMAPGTTLAPGTTAAPLGLTPAPSIVEIGTEGSNSAAARSAGGLLAGVVLGAAGFMGALSL